MTIATDHQPAMPKLPAPSRMGQATAIEQSRAVAEVEAAIVVAMRHPRNVSAAIEAMRETCRRKELADRAFFRYKRGGQQVTGPTVHLARELARVWGNIQYGLSELRRDDEYGQSEMLAFAWDVQTNSRCSSVVINPHRGYTGGRELTELRDIYENNANVGARRVREAIFAVLPAWFTEEAKDLCARTISDGGGVALPVRIANAIEVFGNLGITPGQLETKIGVKSDKWTDQDVAQLRIIRQSLLRGEVTKDEEFPSERVTADEIRHNAGRPDPDVLHTDAETAALLKREGLTAEDWRPGPAAAPPTGGSDSTAGPAPARPAPAGKAALEKLDELVTRLGLEDTGELFAWVLGAEWAATRKQVQDATSWLGDLLRAAGGDTAAAAAAAWDLYRKAHPQGDSDGA